jgi:hypothetical protein
MLFLSQTFADPVLVYPIVLSIHLTEIALFGGMILMTNLRLLGLTFNSVSIMLLDQDDRSRPHWRARPDLRPDRLQQYRRTGSIQYNPGQGDGSRDSLALSCADFTSHAARWNSAPPQIILLALIQHE